MDTFYKILINWFLITRDTHPAGALPYGLHYHHSYEMFIMVSGTSNILVEDQIMHVSKNDIILIKPDFLHKNNGGTKHTRYAVHLTEKYLLSHFTKQVSDILTSVFHNNRITVKPTAFQHIIELLKTIDSQKESALACIHIAEIISIISDSDNLEQVHHLYSKEIVNSILEYINRNYGVINGLDDIAKEMDISKPYLCQIFKKETSVTVSDYLNSVRIKNACDILRHGNKSVTETAILCGYNSPMYFCRVFKDIVHMTPNAYKRHVLNI